MHILEKPKPMNIFRSALQEKIREFEATTRTFMKCCTAVMSHCVE